MEIFLLTMALLVMIGASNVIQRLIPFVPVPIIQIGLGIAAAYMPVRASCAVRAGAVFRAVHRAAAVQ
ncbi:hypothetical protein [Paenibacillus pasadenensis]|uniref:hypothetical protein n=1 Tax=Paenibacillus pasadenensis TaxID=217090 RepID=UPI0004109A34|nr:hypothetical protein [Paenibacillus pasadenensis]